MLDTTVLFFHLDHRIAQCCLLHDPNWAGRDHAPASWLMRTIGPCPRRHILLCACYSLTTWPGSAFSVDSPDPSLSNSLQRSNSAAVYHSLPLCSELVPTPQCQLIKWCDQDQRQSARRPWGHTSIKLNTKLGTSGWGQQEWVYWEPLRNEESVTQLSRDKESRQRWARLYRRMKMELKSCNKSIEYWAAIGMSWAQRWVEGKCKEGGKKTDPFSQETHT